ncbi:MAG: MarR family transcriptional regulator, partial [Deltaproteobacteria bacterium]|nr:MarR family transcriptional regulator [Deltaproteobacteria bacterium]
MPGDDPPKPQGETLQFMQRLWALTHALEVRSKKMAKTLGVTGPQRLVIRLIGQTPGLSARDIAQTLGLHPSTLTGILARLETQALIRRTVDGTDRRRAQFDLTTGGKRIDKERKGTVEAAVRRALTRVSPTVIA